MRFSYPATLAFFAALLEPITCLELEKFPISSLYHSCGSGSDRIDAPFDVNAKISDDLTIRIDISTKASLKSYLVGFGGGAPEEDNYRECGIYVTFHHTGPISEITLGDWDVKGTVTLSKGTIARVTARPYFGFERNRSVRDLCLFHKHSQE